MTIDLNHGGGRSQLNIAEQINALIDEGLEAKNAATKRRPYLGASALGAACERAIQLDYIRANDMPAAPEPDGDFSGRTLRIFSIGHALEPVTIEWLRAAGFVLRTHDEDDRQFGFSVAGGRFRGHVDGVIVGGPDAMQYPALFEHKTMRASKWAEVVKKGMAVAAPQYSAQVALYQAYMDLSANPALFSAVNKDTSELYHELVPFDGDLAQRTSDRAVKILQATDAGELLPRGFNDPDNFNCRMCRWRGFCWG